MLWSFKMRFRILCLCLLLSCEIQPKFSLAVRSWEILSSWCDGILGVVAWLMSVMLLIISTSFTQEALKHLSAVKCSSEKGKPSRAGTSTRGRAVPWIDREWGRYQDPALKPQILRSLIVLAHTLTKPTRKVCHPLLIVRSDMLLVPARLLISACDWVCSGECSCFCTEWDFCLYYTCFISWKIGTY